MLTPRYIARTVAAGTYQDVTAHGRYISIIAVSASTLTLSIDDDAPQQIVSGTQIDCEDRPYTKLRFQNTGGVAANVILLLSETKISDMRGDALLAAMVASLAAIDVDTSNINAGVTVSNGHLNTISGNIIDVEALLTTIDADTGAMAIDLAALEVLLTTIQGDTANLAGILAELQGPIAGGVYGQTTLVAATATLIHPSAAGRHACVIESNAATIGSIWIGFDNLVTNLNGLELQPTQGYTFTDNRLDIYAYHVAGGGIVNWMRW